MHSIDRNASKLNRLGPAKRHSLTDFQIAEVDTKVELIRALVPLGLMAACDMLEAEVEELVGAPYSRGGAYRRHGTNPGSVKLQGQRHALKVPRVRSRQGQEVPLESWATLKESGKPDEQLLRRVLYGLSCRNYAMAAEALPGAIGMSRATVSRTFIEASGAKLKEFRERDLSGLDIVTVFLDGKTFAEDTLVVALGVTMEGRKIPLDFVQTGTENARVLSPFLRGLVTRVGDISQGILVVIDGAKGLRAAVRAAFGKDALVQRCQWHKRENVVAYLPKNEQPLWRRRLQQAYERPTYSEAKKQLEQLDKELRLVNESAAASLREGLEETLTLHWLGVFAVLGKSFKTTNCLESINAMVARRCDNVDHWKTSNQKHRWMAAALLDIEPRLRRIRGYRHLPKLRLALKRELRKGTHEQSRAA